MEAKLVGGLEEVVATFFTDAGHGWLQVPFRWLDKLGIANDISEWSYQDTHNHAPNTLIYLEEDDDYGTFKDAMDKAGIKIDYKHVNHPDYNDDIRSLIPYKKPCQYGDQKKDKRYD